MVDEALEDSGDEEKMERGTEGAPWGGRWWGAGEEGEKMVTGKGKT